MRDKSFLLIERGQLFLIFSLPSPHFKKESSIFKISLPPSLSCKTSSNPMLIKKKKKRSNGPYNIFISLITQHFSVTLPMKPIWMHENKKGRSFNSNLRI